MYDLIVKDGGSPCDANSIVKIGILNYHPIVPLKDLKMQLFGNCCLCN